MSHYDAVSMVVLDNEGNRHHAQSNTGLAILIEHAKQVRYEKPTHRGQLFFPDTPRGSSDAFAKVLLQDAGAFWVTEANRVYLKTVHQEDIEQHESVQYFSLPICENGQRIDRYPHYHTGENFKLIQAMGVLHWQHIVPYVEGETPRVYTPEEMTRLFIDKLRALTRYWETVDVNYANLNPVEPKDELRHRLEGLLFSFLSTLDGSGTDLPGFHIVSAAGTDDQEFHSKLGNNWWPIVEVAEEDQMQWPLHEILSSIQRDEKRALES